MSSDEIEAGALWSSGQLVLRLDGGPPLSVDRPYALVGRTEGVDVQLPEARVSGRHVYLHLDDRGVFAVDLATRTGTRFGGIAAPAGWLEPGQSIEVAGHQIELVEAWADGRRVVGPPPDVLLTDATPGPLARVGLHPILAPQAPWTLSSELVFLGRATACAVTVRGSTVARVHVTLVRTPRRVFLINLVGWGVWLNGRRIEEPVTLSNGSMLVVGSSRFEVQMEPAGGAAPAPSPSPSEASTGVGPQSPARPAEAASPGVPATIEPTAIQPAWSGGPGSLVGMDLPPLPPDLVPAESQTLVLGWMMGVIQATQSTMMRRQEEFQVELLRAIRGLQNDNQEILEQHQSRVESIHHELAALREEIRQRFGGPTAPVQAIPALPKGPPLKVPAATEPPAAPAVATDWLLRRVNQLDEANRSTWRELLGRLGGRAGQEGESSPLPPGTEPSG